MVVMNLTAETEEMIQLEDRERERERAYLFLTKMYIFKGYNN